MNEKTFRNEEEYNAEWRMTISKIWTWIYWRSKEHLD